MALFWSNKDLLVLVLRLFLFWWQEVAHYSLSAFAPHSCIKHVQTQWCFRNRKWISALSLRSEGGFRHTALEPHSNQMFSERSTVSKPGAGPETSASAHTTTLRGSNKDSLTRENHFRGLGGFVVVFLTVLGDQKPNVSLHRYGRGVYTTAAISGNDDFFSRSLHITQPFLF